MSQVNKTPRRLYNGAVFESILLTQALHDIEPCYELDAIEKIFGIPAIGLIERIKCYADGDPLDQPEELNKESGPFWAIKYAHCDDWEAFVARNGSVDELQHLRAYFYDEEIRDKKLMCITHFIEKTQAKLDPKDTLISQNQRDLFVRNGCHYE